MAAPISESPEYRRFWQRIHALATGAFLAIPLAGPAIADFFNNTIVPAFEGPRDRIVCFFIRGLRYSEEKFAAGMLRLLPRRSRTTPAPKES